MASRDAALLARRDLLALAAALPFAGRAAAQSLGPETGPFGVTNADHMDLVDPDRGRTIATRALFPTEPGRYPVIIFSHGFGGSYKTFGMTGVVWASHGYVVLHPTHSDSILLPDPKIRAEEAQVMRQVLARRGEGGARGDLQSAFVKVLDDPFFIDSRLRDVGFLLRALKDRKLGLDPRVLERADTAKLGMSGHSYGGYTTLVCAGARLIPPSAAPVPAGFAGFIGMSGQGPGRMSLNDDSFKGMVKPYMATTGTRDFGAANETPAWRLKPYELCPPGGKYAVVVQGFRHMDFDPVQGDPELGARGAILRRYQLQFWDSVLKGGRAAGAALAAAAKASAETDPVWLRTR
ncbi:MAG: hypothetical protein JSR98_07745 [Proteobacteria bacterium]|nr:hypothetical protein [Pseudomonadota bacterium]